MEVVFHQSPYLLIGLYWTGPFANYNCKLDSQQITANSRINICYFSYLTSTRSQKAHPIQELTSGIFRIWQALDHMEFTLYPK